MVVVDSGVEDGTSHGGVVQVVEAEVEVVLVHRLIAVAEAPWLCISNNQSNLNNRSKWRRPFSIDSRSNKFAPVGAAVQVYRILLTRNLVLFLPSQFKYLVIINYSLCIKYIAAWRDPFINI